MPSTRPALDKDDAVSFASSVLKALREVLSPDDLARLMEAIASQMGFRYYALIHHDDLRDRPPDRVDIKHYPDAVNERLIGQRRYRRDPVIRACFFSPSAFLWSELDAIIALDRKDRDSFEFGIREGLNEGITIAYVRLGECPGSCTFAGTRQPERAERFLGVAQMVGVFAFQAALRMIGPAPAVAPVSRLHPRPRDCVVLAGRGYSNKRIARALSLTPRTVDCYLTEARTLFDAHDRTELVVSAVLAGEVGLHELRRQPK